MTDYLHLLIISAVWPEPDSSAAGRRMMQLIHLFKNAGWSITFGSTSAESVYAFDLSQLGIDEVSVELNDSSFDDFIADLQPSAVVFDRFPVEEQFGWRVAEQCPHTLRILDTEDLHCLRRARQKAVEEGRDFVQQDLLQEESAVREIASIFRCDLSLIISEFEMQLLQERFDIDEELLYYLPFLVDPIPQKELQVLPSFDERRHFITIGNFRHPPNWDAVQYLKAEIWPLIHEQLSEAEMHIYGAYPNERARSLHQPEEGFLMKGRAEDAAAVVQKARVCLAPLRFGAGLKGKLVEAMQCGTPSVTTHIGAEGLAGKMQWSGITANEPEEFASAAVRLYRHQEEWEQAQRQGVDIIHNNFARKDFTDVFLKRVDSMHKNLQNHRSHNFTGAMLMHHTAASTKYMGRWIEEKNR